MVHRWALISGPRGGSRSILARAVADALSARGVRVAGFVQERTTVDDALHVDLVRLGTGERRAVSRSGATPRAPGEETFCEMVFDLGAFRAGAGWLDVDASAADVVVLDGAGKLEASGRGHHAAIAAALASAALPVLVVRDEHLFAVIEAFSLETEPVAALSAPADADAIATFADALSRAVSAGGR